MESGGIKLSINGSISGLISGSVVHINRLDTKTWKTDVFSDYHELTRLVSTPDRSLLWFKNEMANKQDLSCPWRNCTVPVTQSKKNHLCVLDVIMNTCTLQLLLCKETANNQPTVLQSRHTRNWDRMSCTRTATSVRERTPQWGENNQQKEWN